MTKFKRYSLYSFLTICTLVAIIILYADSALAAPLTLGVALESYMGGTNASFCWFCPIFGSIFDAMNMLTTAVSIKLSETFLMVMAVGLLFLIAFKVGKMVVQLQPVDLMQFLTDLFKPLGRAIIASALLVYSMTIFVHLISPILSMSMNLSIMIMEAGGGRGYWEEATQDGGVTKTDICADEAADMKYNPSKVDDNFSIFDVEETDPFFGGSVEGSGDSKQMAFTPDTRASMICALKSISGSLLFGLAVGACIYDMMFTDLILYVIPNIKYGLLGGFLILAHLFILITFPFKLIDAMIRLAFVSALMPLWIVLWVFPATASYTKKAWDMFISSCLIFVCLSVVMGLIITLIGAAIAPDEATRNKLTEALTYGQVEVASSMLQIGTKGFFVTIALTFIAWKMLGTATTLANSFTGAAPDLGVGQGFAQLSTKSAVFAGKTAGTAAKRGLEKMGIDPSKAAGIAGSVGLGVVTGGWSLAGQGALKGAGALLDKFKSNRAAKKASRDMGGGQTPQGDSPQPGANPMGSAPGGSSEGNKPTGGSAGGNNTNPSGGPGNPGNPTGPGAPRNNPAGGQNPGGGSAGDPAPQRPAGEPAPRESGGNNTVNSDKDTGPSPKASGSAPFSPTPSNDSAASNPPPAEAPKQTDPVTGERSSGGGTLPPPNGHLNGSTETGGGETSPSGGSDSGSGSSSSGSSSSGGGSSGK